MSAKDFSAYNYGLDVPASDAAAVTPSDSADLSCFSRALYIGVSGDVSVTIMGGEHVTFTALPVGILPIRVSRVWATATTATNILNLY